MGSQNLDGIAADLQRQRNVVHEKATALRSDLWTVEKDLSRIDAALKALSGETTKAESDGLSAKRPKRTSQMPSAKRSDVIAAMRRLLEKDVVMAADVLKKQVEAQLTEAGFNRFGFAMRWKEALRDTQFVHSANGLHLLDDTADASDAVVAEIGTDEF